MEHPGVVVLHKDMAGMGAIDDEEEADREKSGDEAECPIRGSIPRQTTGRSGK
jgi:hypothetical protein